MVYGSASEEFKEEFLTGLADFHNNIGCLYIVGGDFSILRHASEKNKKTSLKHSYDIFNSIINTFCLREVDMSVVYIPGLISSEILP